MSEELLPCPFCGEEPFGYEIEAHEHSDALKAIIPGIPDHKGSYVVECACGAGHIDDTKDACVARWNRRAAVDRASLEAVPDGWKLVPVEPTDEMVKQSLHLDLSYMPGHEGPDRAAVYRAMLSSAPEQPAQHIPSVDTASLQCGCGEIFPAAQFNDGHCPNCWAGICAAQHTQQLP